MVYVYSIVEHEHYTQVIEYARVGWYSRQREIGAKVGHTQMFLFFSQISTAKFSKVLFDSCCGYADIYTHIHA